MGMLKCFIAVLALAPLAHAQTGPFKAKHLVHEGSILKGTGGVETRVGLFVLQADEGTVNQQTGEIDLRGHAHMILPARADHTLFRYDSTALITDKAADVFADHLHVKNMILQGSGHIQILTSEKRLQAGEIEMHLSTADARLRGVEPSGSHRGLRDFPPDVIK